MGKAESLVKSSLRSRAGRKRSMKKQFKIKDDGNQRWPQKHRAKNLRKKVPSAPLGTVIIFGKGGSAGGGGRGELFIEKPQPFPPQR